MLSMQDICNASPEKPATAIGPTQEEEPVVVKARRVRSTDLESLQKHEADHAGLISKNTTAFTVKQKDSHGICNPSSAAPTYGIPLRAWNRAVTLRMYSGCFWMPSPIQSLESSEQITCHFVQILQGSMLFEARSTTHPSHVPCNTTLFPIWQVQSHFE